MNAGRLIAVSVLAAWAAGIPGHAQAYPFCTDPPFLPLVFPIGTRVSSVFEHNYDSLPGNIACFKLRVLGASTTHITVSTINNNGYLRLYPPGWVITQNGPNFTFGEPGVPGAADGDYARSWTGQLPPQGDLLVVINMRGPSHQYRLHVEAY